MKNIFLTLMVFGIVGCATSPQLYVEPRASDTKNGNWIYKKSKDEFDGELHVSGVLSNDKNSFIRIATLSDLNINRLEYTNGDNYICGIYDSINGEMIFSKKDEESLKYSYRMAVSTNKKVLIIKIGSSVFGLNDQIVPLLNKYESLKIRTTDSCGKVITNTFDITGATHLRYLES